MPNLTGVLIADVIQSRQELHLRSFLGQKLSLASKAHLRDRKIRLPYAVTAGDEFQVIARRIEFLPGLILDLRRRLRPLSLRIGVGIGDVSGPMRTPVNRLGGEAFLFARQAIEDVKHGALHRYTTLTAFRSTRKSFDRVANLVYALHDTLLLDITDSQWGTIDIYSSRQRVDRTARAMNVDKSTASRNLKRGRYWQLADVAETMTAVFQDEWQ